MSERTRHFEEVYELLTPEGYSSLVFSEFDSEAELFLAQFDGTPILGGIPDVLLIPTWEYGVLPIPDCETLYGLGGLIVSQKAVDCFGDLLKQAGELHPARTTVDSRYYFNVTTMVDCLDYDRSVLEFWPELPSWNTIGANGRRKVHHVSKYEFLPDRIGKAAIFKLAEFPSRPPYVTNKFVAEYLAAGLTGFEFRKIWPHPSDAEVRQKFLEKRKRKRRRKCDGSGLK